MILFGYFQNQTFVTAPDFSTLGIILKSDIPSKVNFKREVIKIGGRGAMVVVLRKMYFIPGSKLVQGHKTFGECRFILIILYCRNISDNTSMRLLSGGVISSLFQVVRVDGFVILST